MFRCKIAQTALSFQTQNYFPALDSTWDLFLLDDDAVLTDITIFFEDDPTGYPNVEAYPIDGRYTLIRTDDDVMLISEDRRTARIFRPRSAASLHTLLAQLFYTHTVYQQMLWLHCAIVEDRGRGILFLGPSGVGKTTQAERWAAHRGAAIINGDIGFVQRTGNGTCIAWGSPWHGSSSYCRNAGVPVKALVVLKQASENRLRPLTGFEKVAEASKSVFYPTWLADGVAVCTETLHHLLADLPVYRLDNRADREAVELLAEELERIV